MSQEIRRGQQGRGKPHECRDNAVDTAKTVQRKAEVAIGYGNRGAELCGAQHPHPQQHRACGTDHKGALSFQEGAADPHR